VLYPGLLLTASIAAREEVRARSGASSAGAADRRRYRARAL